MTATASSVFRPLTAAGCEERLAGHRVGRVAATGSRNLFSGIEARSTTGRLVSAPSR